ncbi:catechol 1,2-dioxygenase [Rhodococcus sp. WS3]|uniref:dioxygenase family protein n=1 Tax=unclassified Rhodococcus (in: high G+C Gram-positive bacteria) TaxID=192944 RepID=UPI001142328A|nr:MULTISPECIES: dioxygenase [unclassified Rhodococcus (in: high G+C Gram-positive bacteria)]ROZ42802.1 catechol 1,2-dioxygenase [Rhodococcus sp. WS3]RZL20873.1 MAG: catechol 1,2-dioxygenase [Rhodococcus sp. (in: high G+C Gram-positive bacteria)]
MTHPDVAVDGRIHTVVEDLEQVLLEFVRKHQITHSDYRAATDLIIESIKAGEESLLFDVFFEAEATDVGNLGRDGSPEAIEGPFYLPGAPILDGPLNVMPQRDDEKGQPLLFRGTVTDTDGQPLGGVELDLWHADADGLYSNIHPNIPDYNLRGRFVSEADGTFRVLTILPPPYEIPKDGPTGTVLRALGRHFFRPAHLHIKLRHNDFEDMTSQLYFQGGAYLDNDVAGAVRDGLVIELREVDDTALISEQGLDHPYTDARYDFVLARTHNAPLENR